MAETAFIAIDWDTTNRRIYAIDADGAVMATERDDRGVLAIPAGVFPGEPAAVRARFGDHAILCAGMVGSTHGWLEVPYLPCPADLGALARSLHWIEPGRTAIVPGLSVVEGDRGDAMRGEEVQLLGAIAAGLAPIDALLCQPAISRPARLAALAAGASGRKLFRPRPANPAVLKAQRAVLPAATGIFVVGGITAETMSPWLAAGADAFGIGTVPAGVHSRRCGVPGKAFHRRFVWSQAVDGLNMGLSLRHDRFRSAARLDI